MNEQAQNGSFSQPCGCPGPFNQPCGFPGQCNQPCGFPGQCNQQCGFQGQCNQPCGFQCQCNQSCGFPGQCNQSCGFPGQCNQSYCGYTRDSFGCPPSMLGPFEVFYQYVNSALKTPDAPGQGYAVWDFTSQQGWFTSATEYNISDNGNAGTVDEKIPGVWMNTNSSCQPWWLQVKDAKDILYEFVPTSINASNQVACFEFTLVDGAGRVAKGTGTRIASVPDTFDPTKLTGIPTEFATKNASKWNNCPGSCNICLACNSCPGNPPSGTGGPVIQPSNGGRGRRR